jgi:apolipoprotein N-acyltransferase
MNAVQGIALWGMVALVCAVAGGFIAAAKNRDHSWWAAWCFVLPPMLLVLLMLGRQSGPRPRRPSLDEEDRDGGREFV